MPASDLELKQFAATIKCWGKELGFQQVGITDTNLDQYAEKFVLWLAKKFHGEMHYMSKHGTKRYQPAALVPGTIRVITVRMDYFPPDSSHHKVLKDSTKGYISRYALGRDYHKVLRKRLTQLAEKINQFYPEHGYRAFCDSAPVLEKPLAEKSGLGWIGKHTNIINSKAGSWFFLGEIYTNIALPIDEPQSRSHCGSCQACIDICPTQAIVAPYLLDARRCISYLTIELHDSIPLEFRKAMGNRIYGCDDCQLVCPWNKFAKLSVEADFAARYNLNSPDLIDLFAWDETTFLRNTEGSAIRRIGHEKWLRNLAVALGNAPTTITIKNALKARLQHPSALVKEHVIWALEQHANQDEKSADDNI